MFGYITPVKDELKVCELETFKNYYCGLCFSIRNKFGNIPRLTLTYDSTFFAILLDGISSEKSTINKKSCLKHPLTKKNYILNNKALEYASEINIALVYFKLLDDINDDKSLKSYSFSKLLKPYYDKIENNTLKSTFEKNLDQLHILEKTNNYNSIDKISHPFSNLIGRIFADCPFVLNNDSNKLRNLLYDFGYSFAKWIYLMDAIEDLKEDIEENKFNPINKIYNPNNEPYEKIITKIKEPIDFSLINLSSNCSEIIKKLPFKKNKEIVNNVINLGLIEKYMNIFANL